MFNFFKSKSEKIYSPFIGNLVNLEEVPDPVFSQKMMGDGVAIIPTEGKLYAPFEGEIFKIFDSKHAVILKSNQGCNILIHVGLETVSLEGVPFDVKVKEGDKVKPNELIMEIDLDYIKSKDLPIITPVIIMEDGESDKKNIVEKLQPQIVDYKSVVMKVE